MKRRLVLLLVLSAILWTPQNAFAWNDTGHKVVARVAWDNLSPTTRDKIMMLLLYAPEDSGVGLLNAFDSRQLPYKQRDWFAMLATWPDIIKDRNAPARQTKYSHGGWHYTNLFWRDVNGVATDASDMTTPAENVVERLSFLVHALNDPMTTPNDRAIYTVWVMHLIGDIQQPLHDSARITDLEPQGDQGGNLFELSPKDAPREQRQNLHSYWDGILNIVYHRDTQDSDQPFISMLTSRIEKAYTRKKLVDRIKAGQYDVWAQEGLTASKTVVYPASLKRNEPPSKQYQKAADRYAEEAIALGGYRLAQTLEDVFGKQELLPLPPNLMPRPQTPPAVTPQPKTGQR